MKTNVRFLMLWLLCSATLLLMCGIVYLFMAFCLQSALELSGPCDGYLGVLILSPMLCLASLSVPFISWRHLKNGTLDRGLFDKFRALLYLGVSLILFTSAPQPSSTDFLLPVLLIFGAVVAATPKKQPRAPDGVL